MFCPIVGSHTLFVQYTACQCHSAQLTQAHWHATIWSYTDTIEPLTHGWLIQRNPGTAWPMPASLWQWVAFQLVCTEFASIASVQEATWPWQYCSKRSEQVLAQVSIRTEIILCSGIASEWTPCKKLRRHTNTTADSRKASSIFHCYVCLGTLECIPWLMNSTLFFSVVCIALTSTCGIKGFFVELECQYCVCCPHNSPKLLKMVSVDFFL